ncbi:hypothetical protein SAMN05421736_12120 [Evansella caseinilytica]|uniref:Uncharacterized protein n=1 Tax=Evansella caseinilytica TaxID=1503961 RepID=A0A1H3UHI4_9BACI|nr:hypothetical protein [Evansella caseinilytica]SDZ61265.1 hypothetical protein SAMN05421736_12120 [Evansella caseinilytica]
MKSRQYMVKLIIGIALVMFFGFPGLLGVLVAIAIKEMMLVIIMIVFMLPFLGVGIYMIRSSIKKMKEQKAAAVERTVLQVAQEHGGIISITELAAASEMTISEAEEVLEELTRKGAAIRRLVDSGATVYHFNTFLSSDEKKQAKSIYEL